MIPAQSSGAQSRADRDAVRNCQDCIWCQINIQAQGNFFERGGRPDVQGIGPYFRSGRTIFAREGVIVAGLTHEFAEGIARRRDFRDVVSWGILAKTVQYILSRPPGGLPPGEHRAGGTERYASDARYDIMIPPGSINKGNGICSTPSAMISAMRCREARAPGPWNCWPG